MNRNIVYGPWTHRMSIDDFYDRANQYLTAITTRQKSLSSAYKIFRAGKDIHPNQYKRTMNLMYKIGEPIQEFCQLLETPAELPDDVIPLRYLLATALYTLDEQVNELMPRVTKFHASGRAHSKKTIRHCQDIQWGLRRLIKGCEEVKEEYNNLAKRLLSRAKIPDRLDLIIAVSYS